MAHHTITYDDGELHSSILVAGEFSNWKELPLKYTGNGTSYSRVIDSLMPKQDYMYKFVVDRAWLLANDGRLSSKLFAMKHCLLDLKDCLLTTYIL